MNWNRFEMRKVPLKMASSKTKKIPSSSRFYSQRVETMEGEKKLQILLTYTRR